MGTLIGIDVGTSGTKTLLIDQSGAIVASATVAYPLSQPKPLWSEQEPQDWWDATVKSVREVLDQAGSDPREVKGLGLSGQMHGACFLDHAGTVLRPAILWNDQRTAAECDEITSKVGADKLIELVANPALTGFTAPKILWVRKHEPDVYEKTKKILLPKDYVRYRLSGEFATEVSDASGTLLFDVKNRTWSYELLSILQIDKDLLPPCAESIVPTTKTNAAFEELTGIQAGTSIVGGGGDQAAGAVGNGIVKPGVISATMGTSGVMFAHADEMAVDPQGRLHTFCHAVPGKWHVMGVVLAAGGSMQWFRNNLADVESVLAGHTGRDAYEFITLGAARAPPGAEGLLFLPYLTGERTPHADPFARGCFIGLTTRHTRNHLIRAIMEGATFAMRDSLEIIRAMNVPVEQIRLSGGGARSRLWRQIQADIYGQDCCTINAAEGPAFGVALLAGVGAGVWSSIEQACEATIEVVDRNTVDAATQAVYDRFYPIYGALYTALKEQFRKIADAVEVTGM